jgi:hypothetical protein
MANLRPDFLDQANLPWWVTFRTTQNPETGSIEYQYFDSTTGRQIQQDASGNIAYTTGEPVPASLTQGTPQQGQVLGTTDQGLTVLRMPDGSVTYATPLSGTASDYSQLFEGLVPGQGTAQVPGQGAPQTQIVEAGGQRYAALPQGIGISKPRPDTSGFFSNFASGYGPLVAAALPFTGVGSYLSGLLGPIGGRAATSALGSLVTGGDPLAGLAKGAVGGTVSELGGPILKDTGLSPEASKAILGGTTALLTGGDPLTAALSAYSPALTKTEGEITGPMAETPVMGSEGGGYPGAEYQEPEPTGATAETPALGDVYGYPDQVTQPADLPGGDVEVQAPDLAPLEYEAPEPGVKIPESLLSQVFRLGTATPTGSLGGTAGRATPQTFNVSDVAIAPGLATSPDQAVGAGELESTATGKKRKNVWNVASLKNLQDALGV